MKSRVWNEKAGEWRTSVFKGLWPFDGPILDIHQFRLRLRFQRIQRSPSSFPKCHWPAEILWPVSIDSILCVYFLQRFHDAINAKDRKWIWDEMRMKSFHTHTHRNSTLTSLNRSKSIISMFEIVQIDWKPAAIWVSLRLHSAGFASTHLYTYEIQFAWMLGTARTAYPLNGRRARNASRKKFAFRLFHIFFVSEPR